MKEVKITKVSWNNIHLNIIFKGEELEKYDFYLANRAYTQVYPIKLEKQKDEYCCSLNITNIQNSKMLANGAYYFVYYDPKNPKDEEGKTLYTDVEITTEVGYHLYDMDRIFRYSKDTYAYTIDFKIKENRYGKLICYLESVFMTKNKKPYRRKISAETSKLHKYIFRSFVYYGEHMVNGFYHLLSFLHPKNGKRILFMSETRTPISGNLKAIDDRMKERGLNKQYKISYDFHKSLEMNYIQLACHWLRLMWKISKQDYIFVDDYVPLFKFINLSKKTKLIQVWHAGVGFKSVGYARFGKSGSPYPFASCHRKYDYAVVGGEALISVYEEVFGIDKEKFIASGLPRLDNYLNKEKQESFKKQFFEKYPELKNKKIILFAPTYRGNGQRSAFYPYEKIDLDLVKKLSKKGYVFLLKMHPFVSEKMDIPKEYQDCIIDFSDYKDINELFYITDLLITDYSSNIYEFSLFDKPILFYVYDLDSYELVRTVHRPLKEFAPGKLCYTFEELAQTIENEEFETEKLKKFRMDNMAKADNHASDRVIDRVLGIKE